MRIALISSVFPPMVGGIERFSEALAEWLASKGHHVVVLTRVAAPSNSDMWRNYQVIRQPSVATLARALRSADAVHIKSLSTKSLLAAFATGRRAVVTHAHHQAICPDQTAWGRGFPCSAGPGAPGPCAACVQQGVVPRLTVARQRAAAHLAGPNVCISRYLAARLGLPRTTIIYNPVAPIAFRCHDRGSTEEGLVSFAGRLSPAKGLDVLLEAIALLRGVRLEIAGEGAAGGACRRLARELGIDDRVRFLGPLPLEGVLELYARSALVCVPSLWEEPFGYAAAEAMACGRAVAATPSGALPELLAEGRGYLSSSREPRHLAETIGVALADSVRRATVEERARQFAESRLHIDVVGPQYVRAYETTT